MSRDCTILANILVGPPMKVSENQIMHLIAITWNEFDSFQEIAIRCII